MPRSSTRSAVLLLLASAASSADGVSLRLGHRADPAKDPLGEGSKIIEGPDCGRAKLVIPKFAHASKVGQLAGVARGAVTVAIAAADSAAATVTKAKTVGAAVGGSTAIDTAVADVESAATAAKTAAGTLETELGTFKTKISSSEVSGENVEQADMTKLRKLTEETQKATDLVHEKVERLQEKTAEASKKSDAKVAEAAAVASALLEKAGPTVDEAKDAGQKAGWAEGDADALVKVATEVLPKIDTKSAEVAEQAPVYDALKANVESLVTAVNTAKGDVTTAKTELAVAVPPLEAALAPLEAAVKDAKSGATKTDFKEADVAAAEKAHDAATDALQKLKDKMSRLSSAQGDLKAELDEVAKKLEA